VTSRDDICTPFRNRVYRTAFRLLDALTTLLVTAARTRPVVVVLDDLHWATPASLVMLEFVVRYAPVRAPANIDQSLADLLLGVADSRSQRAG
jgi:predicted ATPase